MLASRVSLFARIKEIKELRNFKNHQNCLNPQLAVLGDWLIRAEDVTPITVRDGSPVTLRDGLPFTD